MANCSKIEFQEGDFHINGKPLLAHLAKHERFSQIRYMLAFVGSGSLDHLIKKQSPDLELGMTALYLCSHCGGYESALGAKIQISDDNVSWLQIGHYSDHGEDDVAKPFEKVREYHFEKSQYFDFIETSKIHETPYYG